MSVGIVGVVDARPDFLCRLRISQTRGYGIDCSRRAAVIVTFAEGRKHVVAQYAAAGGIGQRTFDAGACADHGLAQIAGHEQQHTVVIVFFAESPEVEEFVGIAVYVTALDVVDHHGHHLCRRCVSQAA